MICRPKLPAESLFARALNDADQRLPSGVPVRFIARSVLAHVARKEERIGNFEDPFAAVPQVGPINQAGLHNAVSKILGEFKLAVEDRRGYTLLWNNNKAKDEKAAQTLFDLAVRGWCVALGLDLQAEVNLGRGPVDFRVSNGPALKTVVEMKLARHPKFWSGIRNQLPTYMRVDNVQAGYFVTIVFSDSDAKKLAAIDSVIESVRTRVGYKITSIVVDARRSNKPSASRV